MQVKTYAHIEKASKLKEGEVEFIVSTGAFDAHGERINVDGINLKDYKKNPVVLWAHDGYNLPIARTSKIWKEGGKLMARAEFYLKDDFPKKVYNYIVDGFLNAVSIGGMVEEWGQDGNTISKLMMKEFSVVPIPANQEALVAAKSLDTEAENKLEAMAKTYARKRLADSSDDINKDIETLESLVATLKEVANGETHEEAASKNRHVVLRQAQAVDHQTEKIIKRIKLKD